MAKRTLILTQRQLDEITGGNLAYLDNVNSDFSLDGGEKVYAGEHMGDHDSEPLTGDKYAGMRTIDTGIYSRNRYRAGYMQQPLNCSTKREWEMKNLYTEENQALTNNQYGKSGDMVTNTNASTIKTRVNDAQKKINSNNPQLKAQGERTLERMRQNNPELDTIINGYNNAMANDKSLKNIQSNVLGQDNVYQKVGGTKQAKNGMANSSKKPENGIITDR